MTVSKKKVRKIILTALRENLKINLLDTANLKNIRRHVNKTLRGEDINVEKTIFREAIDKLVAKGSIVKRGKVYSLPETIQRDNEPETMGRELEMADQSYGETDRTQDVSAEEQGAIDAVTAAHIKSGAHITSSPSAPSSSHWKPQTTESTDYDNEPAGDVTILLFYEYCTPQMTRSQQDEAIAYCYGTLKSNDITGRLRVGKEGFNGTLTGKHDGIRKFTSSIRTKYPHIFRSTDFKYVDGLPDKQLLKGLKVWPVSEIVTYGFDPSLAPLELTGTHLKPREFHEAMKDPRAVMIDVRNFNETLIGRFAPTNIPVLDPCMRRSTEFPVWVEENKHLLENKRVLMYCTGGVRCERASAFLRNLGVTDVSQLEGGIHRYLEEYKEDGGFWLGKNYTFDKRFSHGANKSEVVSFCVHCSIPWDRYQAQAKCTVCSMEVLLCKACQRMKPAPKKDELFCPLCKNKPVVHRAKVKGKSGGGVRDDFG